jgi:hypothetical protein
MTVASKLDCTYEYAGGAGGVLGAEGKASVPVPWRMTFIARDIMEPTSLRVAGRIKVFPSLARFPN